MPLKTAWNALMGFLTRLLTAPRPDPEPPIVPPPVVPPPMPPSPPQTPPEAPVPPQVPPGPPQGADATDAKLLALHNAARAGLGLPALRPDARLGLAAKAYARKMAAAHQMSHTVGGQTLAARLASVGYLYGAGGENVAAGYADAAAVMQGWFNSPPHYANIVSPQFLDAGFGVADDAAGTAYWCAIFGRPAARDLDVLHEPLAEPPALVHYSLMAAR